METKEAIISTISEFNNKNEDIRNDIKFNNESKNIDELEFLLQIKEKMLVLFEGLRHNNSNNIELRTNMVINYLELQLSLIEDRLNKITSTNQ